MKIIKDHFEGNITYIHGDMVLNGCQFFNIKDLDKVCKKHEVPDTLKQEVIDLYNSKDALSLEEVLKLDRLEIVQFDYKELLGILVRDKDWSVRKEVAKHNHKYLLNILVKDEHWWVREEVARHGYKDLLDILVNDKDWCVREEVARHDYKDLLDILVNDEDGSVREEVAKHDYKDLLDILVRDKDEYVRNQANETLESMK